MCPILAKRSFNFGLKDVPDLVRTPSISLLISSTIWSFLTAIGTFTAGSASARFVPWASREVVGAAGRYGWYFTAKLAPPGCSLSYISGLHLPFLRWCAACWWLCGGFGGLRGQGCRRFAAVIRTVLRFDRGFPLEWRCVHQLCSCSSCVFEILFPTIHPREPLIGYTSLWTCVWVD